MKTCLKCLVDKSESEFNFRPNQKIDGTRSLRPYCKACSNSMANISATKRSPAVIERRKQYNAIYGKKPEVIEKKKESYKAYQSNPDKRERINKFHRDYYYTNKGKLSRLKIILKKTKTDKARQRIEAKIEALQILLANETISQQAAKAIPIPEQSAPPPNREPLIKISEILKHIKPE